MTERKLLILLTGMPGVRSKMFGVATHSKYTHASIGLEEDPNTFYSFVYKGFIVEKITRYVKPHKTSFPCQVYELSVPEKTYNTIKKLLNSYVERKSSLKYTKLGVALCLLRIPYKKKSHYFCSHFVASILERSRATKLQKNSSLYAPKDLRKLKGMKLRFQGNLQEMLAHFGIAA